MHSIWSIALKVSCHIHPVPHSIRKRLARYSIMYHRNWSRYLYRMRKLKFSHDILFILHEWVMVIDFFSDFSGGNAPSYVYRMLGELYHPEDYEL